MVSFDEFKKLELKVATIVAAERVEGSEKLIRLELDLGERLADGAMVRRQVLAGIAAVAAPEALVGRQIAVVANLEPRKLMGLESNGMLLAAHGEDGAPVLLGVERPVPPGSIIS